MAPELAKNARKEGSNTFLIAVEQRGRVCLLLRRLDLQPDCQIGGHKRLSLFGEKCVWQILHRT